MDAARWEAIERILDEALDRTPAEWPALLDDACGEDHELRGEVMRLLAQHGRANSLLDSDAGAIAARVTGEDDEAQATDPLTGAILGPWRVVEQVGRGGMSRVFLGERTDGAFEQRVAIKVLRAGLDSASDLERFRIERKILARLEHPNIARLLDGGVAPDGRPYLVMEFIDGAPITDYCRTRALSTSDRLRLFLQVASATEAAHRQLIVHRDLKPTNILVDADGRPRLLDFGIATILDPDARASEPTATRRRWLSPNYAAPEQFTGARITTGTDVYQLGAVLYELLTDKRAFDGANAGDRSLEQRVLRDDPPPPSRHLPSLRGDLDAIILKALRKEPAARYASVAELADDVMRALDGAPVRARAGSRGYRWGRFVRKRALPLSLALASVLAIVVYAGTVAVQNQRIRDALARANVEREKAEQVAAFLVGLFDVNDPRVGRGDTISARALLARGELRARAFDEQPEVQADLFEAIGWVRSSLGAFSEARGNLEEALKIRLRLLGEAHPDVAQVRVSLARLLEYEGRLPEAITSYRDALVHQRAVLGDTSPDVHQTLFQLANSLHTSGQNQAADSVFLEWEQLARGRPLQRNLMFASQLVGLGQYLSISGANDTVVLDRAERYLRDALRIQLDVAGSQDTRSATTMQLIASMRAKRGDAATADSLFREAIAALRAVYPTGHPELATALSGYGNMLQRSDRLADGIRFLREASEMADSTLGATHPLTAVHRANYGNALREFGQFADAERPLRTAAAELRTHYGESSLMAVRTQLQLADALGALGRFSEAEQLMLGGFTSFAERRGLDHPQTQYALRFVVKLYERVGREADAARYRARLAKQSTDSGTASSATGARQ
jgi:serine/threonine-protein kinase